VRRAKNLDDEDLTRIVGIIDGWSGRLTWDDLIDAIERHLFARYTRQALHKHIRILEAFQQRKAVLVADGGRPRKVASTPELQAALDKIARLQGENERLEAENTRLLEQFVRWAYNASTRGLDAEYLNLPLPPVNR
jgi:hypothetical protein